MEIFSYHKNMFPYFLLSFLGKSESFYISSDKFLKNRNNLKFLGKDWKKEKYNIFNSDNDHKINFMSKKNDMDKFLKNFLNEITTSGKFNNLNNFERVKSNRPLDLFEKQTINTFLKRGQQNLEKYKNYCEANYRSIPQKKDYKIKKVMIFHRHGDRSPIKEAEKDIKRSDCVKCDFKASGNQLFSSNTCTLSHCSVGDLTIKGYNQTKKLGYHIAKEYFPLIKNVKDSEIELRSTRVRRTEASISGVVDGMVEFMVNKNSEEILNLVGEKIHKLSHLLDEIGISYIKIPSASAKKNEKSLLLFKEDKVGVDSHSEVFVDDRNNLNMTEKDKQLILETIKKSIDKKNYPKILKNFINLKNFKKRVSKFKQDPENMEEISFINSNFGDDTKNTIINSMYEGIKTLENKKILIRNIEDDNLLSPRNCPNYQNLVQSYLSPNIAHVESKIDTIMTQFCGNLPIDCRLYFCSEQNLSRELDLYFNNWKTHTDSIKLKDPLIKLVFGKISKDIIDFVNSEKKITVISSHDNTLGTILAGLKSNSSEHPPYASSIFLEIWENSKNENFVRVVYNDKLNVIDSRHTNMALDNFVEYLSNYKISNDNDMHYFCNKPETH